LSKNLENITVAKNTKIKDVLIKINQNGKNGVFVKSKNKIIGVITDSDIRRSILEGKFNSKKTASAIMKKDFLSIPFKKKLLGKKILLESNKILLPVLKNKELVTYFHTSEFNKKKSKSFYKKILLIGGLGYIGSVLIDLLLQEKYKVNVLDINFYGCNLKKKILKNKNLKIIYGDCNDKKKLRLALKGCTDVIHLGEIVGDPAVSLNDKFSIRNNYLSTDFLVSECIKHRINKFIFTSSCSVYGESKLKCSENSKLNPVSLYAKCKIECEKSILSFKSKQFCPVILRLSTVYGDSPRKRFDLVVNRFILMAIKKIKISLFGGNSWRPFISVNDVSRAIIKVLKTKENIIKRQIFNLGGDGENYRIVDIIKEIQKHLNINFEETSKIADKRNYKVSFEKILKKISFKPRDSLKKSINLLIKKYKSTSINYKNINYYNDKKIAQILNLKSKVI